MTGLLLRTLLPLYIFLLLSWSPVETIRAVVTCLRLIIVATVVSDCPLSLSEGENHWP